MVSFYGLAKEKLYEEKYNVLLYARFIISACGAKHVRLHLNVPEGKLISTLIANQEKSTEIMLRNSSVNEQGSINPLLI